MYGKNIYIDIDTFPSIDYFPAYTISQVQILICQMNWSVVLLNTRMKIRLWSVFHKHIHTYKIKKNKTKKTHKTKQNNNKIPPKQQKH